MLTWALIFCETELDLCGDIYFDKTKDMNNYNLKTVIYNHSEEGFRWDEMKAGYDRCDGIAFNILCSVLSRMHSTITVKISDNAGWYNGLGEPQGQEKDIFSSSVNFSLHLFFLRGYWRSHQAYPIYPDSLKMISLKELVNDEGIPLIHDWRFWIFSIVCCFVSVIILALILEISMSLAAL